MSKMLAHKVQVPCRCTRLTEYVLLVPSPFEVEVFVAGFASVRRTPENATRSQRAFLRLAKSASVCLPSRSFDTDY